jgi:hypothetical protein
MLGENIVLVLLESSVAGAGLIIAIYALIAPLSRKIFEGRLEMAKGRLKQFEDIKAQTTPEEVAKYTKALKTVAGQIKELKTFPSYLGPLVLIDFALFAVTALLCSLWFTGTREEMQVYVILAFFIASLFLFASVGIGAIIEVYRWLTLEFEQLKKEREETEEIKKKLEKLKEEFKPSKSKNS